MAEFSPRALRDTTLDRQLFVDRASEIATVVDLVSRGGNVVIAGDRRIGKTSILHRVESELEARGLNVLWLDGRLAVSAHDLLAQLLHALVSVGQLPGLRQPAVAASRYLVTSGGELLDDLAALRSAVPAGDRAIVLLDDPPVEIARTLFGRLRDELWELPITWVVVAADRAALTDPPADAFWIRVLTLKPLGDAAAAELLRARMGSDPVADELIDKLVEEGAGSPGRLVALGHDVFVAGRSADETISDRRERDRAAAALGPSAQRLLAELETNGPASASDPLLLRRMQWNRSRAAQVLKQLEGAGLVTASDRRGAAGRPQRVYAVVRP